MTLNNQKRFTTRDLTTTALLLAICILSQYFKNLSVYITGPIVNATIILAVLGVGLYSGIIISIIAPITAFFFTGSPIMAAIPLMFPVIMISNCILAYCIYFFESKNTKNNRLIIGMILGSLLKAAFLAILVVLIILPLFGGNVASKLPNPDALPKFIATARITFSITQLTTSLIGCALAYVIWIPLKKVLKIELS